MKKSLLMLLLAAIVFALPSCKKDELDPNDIENPDGRTGLEALTDADAENYAVLVIGNDTLVFDETRDSFEIFSGKLQSFPHRYDYMAAQFVYRTNKPLISKMTFMFRKPSNYLYVVKECTLPDTLIHLGRASTINSWTGVQAAMWLIPQNSNESNTAERNDTAVSKIEVLSKTDITMPDGCKKVKIKVKITNLTFWDSICGPEGTYTIKEGIMQLVLRHSWEE